MKDKYGSRKILHIICRQCLTQPEDPERPACFRFSFVVHGFLSQYLFHFFYVHVLLCSWLPVIKAFSSIIFVVSKSHKIVAGDD